MACGGNSWPREAGCGHLELRNNTLIAALGRARSIAAEGHSQPALHVDLPGPGDPAASCGR